MLSTTKYVSKHGPPIYKPGYCQILFTSDHPEPTELISSSEPPGSFTNFHKNLKSEGADEDDEFEESSEVSLDITTLSLSDVLLFLLLLLCRTSLCELRLVSASWLCYSC